MSNIYTTYNAVKHSPSDRSPRCYCCWQLGTAAGLNFQDLVEVIHIEISNAIGSHREWIGHVKPKIVRNRTDLQVQAGDHDRTSEQQCIACHITPRAVHRACAGMMH